MSTQIPVEAPVATPAPKRDVVVDAARAFSILVVVCFHAALWRPCLGADGSLTTSVLSPGPFGWWVSWLVMVMPMFFIAGGFGHAISVDKMHKLGTSYIEFLLRRARRLIVPLALFVALGATTSTLLHWFGSDHVGRLIGENLTRLLWFIAVYLVIVAVAPLMVWLQDRYGMPVVVMFAVASFAVTLLAGPANRASAGTLDLRSLQLLIVWPACHQLGIALQRGFLRGHPLHAIAAIGAAVVTILFGIGEHVWPVAAVGFGDAPEGNIAPPTAAIILLAIAQTGLLALLHERPLLHRPHRHIRTLVAFGNLTAMTIYLWHVPLIAVAILIAWGLARVWPELSVVFFNPWAIIVTSLVLVYTVTPLVAQVENKLVPAVKSVSRPRQAVASVLLTFAGAWIVWRHGMLIDPTHPLAALGVAAIVGGTVTLFSASRREVGACEQSVLERPTS